MKEEDNMMEKKNEMWGEGEEKRVSGSRGVGKKKNVSHLRCSRVWGYHAALTRWAKFCRAYGAGCRGRKGEEEKKRRRKRRVCGVRS